MSSCSVGACRPALAVPRGSGLPAFPGVQEPVFLPSLHRRRPAQQVRA